MIVVPYKAAHLEQIDTQDAQVLSQSFVSPAVAKQLESSMAFSILDGDEVLLCGGVYELWPHRSLAWSYISRHAGRSFIGITRKVREFLDLCPYKRIEIEVAYEFAEGHRWARVLGFELETPRARYHRADGGDNSVYVRIR